MINDPTIDLEALVAYEGRMGEEAQAARERVQAMRAETPLSELIQQSRAIGPRPTLAALLAQDGFTALSYDTEAMFDGPHDPSVGIMTATIVSDDGDPLDMEAMVGMDVPQAFLDAIDEHETEWDLSARPMMAWGFIDDESDEDEEADVLLGTVFKFTNAGQGTNFNTHLGHYVDSPRDVLVCDEIVVDPWQLWRIKAMGFSAVILHIGAQVTPDLTNLIRVCEEVGLEWVLKADYTHQIDEGVAAYQDAFAKQPPLIALGLTFDGEQITHQKVTAIKDHIPLPDGGQYLPFMFTGDKFLESLMGGTNPVVNAYLDVGIAGGIAVDSTTRRFFSGQ